MVEREEKRMVRDKALSPGNRGSGSPNRSQKGVTGLMETPDHLKLLGIVWADDVGGSRD
jgi:hypothetical protein